MGEDIEAIRGSLSRLLMGKRVMLVMTGSISIYKVPDVARGLIRHGAYVSVLMSRTAAKLLSPMVMQWATGHRPLVRLSGYAEHVRECAGADALVAVPATANLISKLANGITDNAPLLCLAVALGAGKPIMVVPAMNISMWNNPVVQDNVSRLRALGVKVLDPIVEEGKAKLPLVEEIVESTIDLLAPRDMSGLSVLVTSGPTREHIDDVKYITTPSSGLTGYFIAREAAARGANVFVVSGPVDIKYPSNVNVIKVTSVVEMHEAVLRILRNSHIDIAIFAAAPLDFYVKERVTGKLDSDLDTVNITLVRAPKIVNDAKRESRSTIVVGYKAEVNVDEKSLIERTLSRMRNGAWDMAIAHRVGPGIGFGTLTDSYIIIEPDGTFTKVGPLHKRELARIILDKSIQLLRRRTRT